MSEREKAIQLLNVVPDNKIPFIIGYIQGLTAEKEEIKEVAPDEWDLKMIAEAEKENDDSRISFDEILKAEGLTYADLQS